MEFNGKLDTILKLEWAIDTIREQLLFGRDELGAAKARELRAKGVMIDACKEFKELEEKLKVAEKSFEDEVSMHNQEWLEHEATKRSLKVAVEALEMFEDHTKLPHQHKEYHTKLCCITEIAHQALEKIKAK
jgi:hypothetical protein